MVIGSKALVSRHQKELTRRLKTVLKSMQAVELSNELVRKVVNEQKTLVGIIEELSYKNTELQLEYLVGLTHLPWWGECSWWITNAENNPKIHFKVDDNEVHFTLERVDADPAEFRRNLIEAFGGE